MSAALHILNKVFGYPVFRGEQSAIIEHVIAGGDALVLMPTGGGKSLCYQIPALVRAGTAIVVSPLIALMQDQVDALIQLGVRAAFLNSSQAAVEQREVQQRLATGALDLLYVAPERLLTPRFLSLIESIPLALFAIDEAHCVSQWGHDFRPEYRELVLLHQRFPAVPRLALTATADAPTRREIVERFGLDDARQFVASFDRPNIRYRVENKLNARRQLLDFLIAHRGEAGIVYCLSRKKVDETAIWLSQHGVLALPYHAGMDAAVRLRHQQRFLREEGVVMVATIAFGMGIDKPDVRFVAHMDLPKSLEGYYQETGRAGRDGLPAEAWMVYGLGDAVLLGRMIAQSEADEQHKRIERGKLEALIGYAETMQCRRHSLLTYFGENYNGKCNYCDNCIDPPRSWDATVAVQKALSCVYRTGQRFGVGHLIEVLRGIPGERMQRFGHAALSVFSIGQEIDTSTWRSIFRQLVALGLLETDAEGYGSLRLTASSRAVLKGEQAIYLRQEADRAQRRAKSEAMRSRQPRGELEISAQEEELWTALRARRASLAREQNVPAYVIFHDATLLAMLRARPHSMAEMSQISGVGVHKLARYGEAFLAVFAQYSRI